MAGTVINLRGRKPQTVGAGEVYIGRQMSMGGWHLPASPWANPFGQRYGSRGERIRMYREWLAGQPALMSRIGELTGKNLACWCAPDPCHGDVLRELSGNTCRGRIIVGQQPASGGTYAVDTRRGRFGSLHPDRVGPIVFTESSDISGRLVSQSTTAASITCLWAAIQVPGCWVGESGPDLQWLHNRAILLAGKRPPLFIDTYPERATIFWNGKYMARDAAYVDAYIRNYAAAVATVPEYKTVEDIVSRGHDITIIGGATTNPAADLRALFGESPAKFRYELILAIMWSGYSRPWIARDV